MNRKQRRSAKHRSPQLQARAIYEQRLREGLEKRGIRLISAEVGTHEKTTLWVLTVRREKMELVLSAKPQPVLSMIEAVVWRMDHPHEEAPKAPEQVVQGPITAGPSTKVIADRDVPVPTEDDGADLAALIPGGR